MNKQKGAMLIAKLSLKLQCQSLVYIIVAIHIYFLKEI